MKTQPRRNRVDPWGDLHAVTARGMFTGNRGCLVADEGRPVRHHNGSLWITCLTRFRDWQHPLDAPRTWTPLFFLDDAVALAAGHRPCGLCRRQDYLAYRGGVTVAVRDNSQNGEQLAAPTKPVLAVELNRRLAAERHRRGRGFDRAGDRLTVRVAMEKLPAGSVALLGDRGHPHLVTERHVQPFSFDGWGLPEPRPQAGAVPVLTPPTSLAALRNGFTPTLHHSAASATEKVRTTS